ncbi:MAG: hypothetical protein HFI09_04310 [Bacilli bacterium]|nr:hypothetical protein [Bacilli bacterium]
MATTKNYRDYLLEQLNLLEGISCRAMMGEYLLYYQGILFGGIYDNRFLVKKGIQNQNFNMPEVIPYPKAKPMYMVMSESKEEIRDIVLATVQDLS